VLYFLKSPAYINLVESLSIKWFHLIGPRFKARLGVPAPRGESPETLRFDEPRGGPQ
jgi:hypothetical protein